MRHNNQNRKLSRKAGPRRALLRTLAVSLILKEKIKTTEAKAKELRPFVEKLVTEARKGTLASQRNVTGVVGQVAGKKLMTVLGPKYKERKGGYTRITKMGIRKLDASPVSQIEFI